MANEAFLDLDGIKEKRLQQMEDEYHALQSDQERFDWLVELSAAWNYFSDAKIDIIKKDESNLLNDLLTEYFNPRKPDGEPDHDKFAERMDILLNAKLENRITIGQDVQKEMQEGPFAGAQEKSYYAVLESESGLRHQTIDGMYNVALHPEKEFWIPYGDRMEMETIPPEDEIETTFDVDGKNLFDKDGLHNFYENMIGDRFVEAVKKRFNTVEENLKNTGKEEEKSALRFYFDGFESKVNRDTIFTAEEQDRLEEYGKSKRDFYARSVLSDKKYVNGPAAETEEAFKQFNTKRSRVFLGRESTEHAELKNAAIEYMSCLEIYQASGKLSIDERRRAVKKLQEASRKMTRLAEIYEEKKGNPATNAGFERLCGARNLKALGEEMTERLSDVLDSLDKEEKEKKERKEKKENYIRRKEKQKKFRDSEAVQNENRSKEAPVGTGKKMNLDELAEKKGMNIPERERNNVHQSKGKKSTKQSEKVNEQVEEQEKEP